MSSRFFSRGDSDSESSSSEEEELYSEEEKAQAEESEESSDDEEDSDSDSDSDDDAQGAARFLKGGGVSDDESDEDETAKVLKSAKDKRFEELEGTIRLIENAEKINDWAVIQERECRRTPG
jgi:translation initiation factor 3 subunit C